MSSAMHDDQSGQSMIREKEKISIPRKRQPHLLIPASTYPSETVALLVPEPALALQLAVPAPELEEPVAAVELALHDAPLHDKRCPSPRSCTSLDSVGIHTSH